MTEEAQVYISENRMSLVGKLDFTNAMTVYKASLPVFSAAHNEIIIDFAGLLSGNSVVIAMIVNWIKLGIKRQKQVKLENLSQGVESLLAASRLSSLIQSHADIKA